jgi:hypothetical protein
MKKRKKKKRKFEKRQKIWQVLLWYIFFKRQICGSRHVHVLTALLLAAQQATNNVPAVFSASRSTPGTKELQHQQVR